MKKLFLGFFTLLFSCTHGHNNLMMNDNPPGFQIKSDVLTTTSVERTPKSNYLSMNIPYGPVEKVRKDLENKLGITLKNRGEAHITTLTPPEFKDRLSEKVSINDINNIASEIQKARFEIICVGSGSAELDGKMESTYYIVVRSQDLLNLRTNINDLYLHRGGSEGDFKPQDFYPHITLGFTKKDLHIHQGVVKDIESCIPQGMIEVTN